MAVLAVTDPRIPGPRASIHPRKGDKSQGPRKDAGRLTTDSAGGVEPMAVSGTVAIVSAGRRWKAWSMRNDRDRTKRTSMVTAKT